MSALGEELLLWSNETRAIMVSIKRIVEYFGNDEEFTLLREAMKLAEAYFDGILPAFEDAAFRANVGGIRIRQFACRRTIATMISPLLQIIVEPVPEFIPLARAELEPAHCSALIRHVGAFTGSIGTDVCDIIWRDFPELAPEGWPGSGAQS